MIYKSRLLASFVFVCAVCVDWSVGADESSWTSDVLEKYDSGYVPIVKKSERLLAMGLNGELVDRVSVLKSELDPKLFGFLQGDPDDEVELIFPLPVAVSGKKGHRTYRYDQKTPEGEYRICRHHNRLATKHTVAMSINYPNPEDLEQGLKRRRISRKEFSDEINRHKRGYCPTPDTYLGGWIRIHGPSDKQIRDWKKNGVESCDPDGRRCVSLDWEEYLREDNEAIGVVVPGRKSLGCLVLELTPLFYLYKTIPDGTPIVILP